MRNAKQFIQTQFLTTTSSGVTYQPGSGMTGDISAATATNVTTSAQTVTVNMAASTGTTLASANTIVQTRNVPPNGSAQLWELIGQKVRPGGVLYARASAPSSITLSVGGYESI